MRVLFLAMALVLPLAAEAATCNATRGSGQPWSWRLIDGKKWWYRGQPGLSKSSLHWASTQSGAARAEKARSASPTNANLMYLDCVQSGGDRCDRLRTGTLPLDETALERWIRWLRVPWSQ